MDEEYCSTPAGSLGVLDGKDVEKDLITRSEIPTVTPQITGVVKVSTWLSPYRMLFAVVFMLNAIGLLLEAINHWFWASGHLSTLVIVNILIAINVRSEWVLRLLYWISVKVFRPQTFSIQIRTRVVGFFYHIGGIHSGCGVSALLWTALTVAYHFKKVSLYPDAILVTLVICLTCLGLCCASAFPFFRGPHHNAFEIIHRFVGWIGIIGVTSYTMLEAFWDESGQRWDSTPSRLLTKFNLWALVEIYVIIGLAWVTTAKVRVTLDTPSDKATVIKVPGGLTSGLHTRISAGGLREWHIFGSISAGKKADCHYIVAAVQGEFTKMLNIDRPKMLYTKLWKPCGLPYFSRLFNKGLAVCTGSGIGAIGSTCMQHDSWFLIWIGPNLEKTYGKEIMSLICERIPERRRIIWDTRGPLGRPDIFKLLQQTHRRWQAEVSMFIGSPALNQEVLRGCRAIGLPAFGSIWDA